MPSPRFAPHKVLKLPASTQVNSRPHMHILMLLDTKVVPASRSLLVEWCRKMRRRGGLAFVSGPHARVVSRLTAGLQPDIYNGGMREIIPLAELMAWFPWQSLVVIQQGQGWDIPLAQPLKPMNAIIEDASVALGGAVGEELFYQRLGLRYSDK